MNIIDGLLKSVTMQRSTSFQRTLESSKSKRLRTTEHVLHSPKTAFYNFIKIIPHLVHFVDPKPIREQN